MAESLDVPVTGCAVDDDLPDDVSVVVEEANLQEQRDEVLVIQSIYEGSDEERIKVVREPDENGRGLFYIQIKIPVVTPTDSCQMDIMLPVSEDSAPCKQDEDSPMEEEGQKEGTELVKEGGAQGEEGATAMTPPPRIGKAVALERSLSGQRWTGSFELRYLCPLTLHLTFPPKYPSDDPPVFALSCMWLRSTQISALCRQLDKLWETTPNMPIAFTWVDWLENETFRCLGLTDSLMLTPENNDCDSQDIDGRAVSECYDLGEAIHTMLQYSNQKDAVEFCKSMQECCLCLDEKPGTKFFRLEPCKHHFCYDCIATHCSLHVTAGTIELITCPASECKVVVSPDILQTVLSPDAFIRWETLSLQRSLDEMDDIVYCPRCQAVVIREQDATLNLGYCLACCYSFCTQCEQPWHQGSACTSELERLDAQAQRVQARDQRAQLRYEELRQQVEERSKTIATIKSKTVTCPHCKAPVEKIEGGVIVDASEEKKNMSTKTVINAEQGIESSSRSCQSAPDLPRTACPEQSILPFTAWPNQDFIEPQPPLCNKMTCRCGKSFCWLCGKGITGYEHFRNGGCVLFRYQLEQVVRHIIRRRPPDALLWMQARAEAIDAGGNRQIRCTQCKQTNFKVDNNNHIRCWNCKSHLCFHCRGRITGVVTKHFTPVGCPQHS